MAITITERMTRLEMPIEYDTKKQFFTFEPPCGSNIEIGLADMKTVIEMVPIPKELKEKRISNPGPWTIALKCQEPHFTDLLDGRKKFDLRSKKKKRIFKPGQIIIMKKWDEAAQEYTGHYAAYIVTYVLDTATLPKSYGIDAGDCWVLGLQFQNDSYKTPDPFIGEDVETITD